MTKQTYSQAAFSARSAATLEQEAAVWQRMVELHNLPFNYWIAATERLSLVNGAIQSQTLPMPAGLFPNI